MKKFLLILSVVMLVLGTVGNGRATVIDFESFSIDNYEAIPNGYEGFNWKYSYTNQICVLNGSNSEQGFKNGIVSGNMVAFNTWGYSPSLIELVGSGTFTFNGAWFTSAYDEQEIWFIGYNNGEEVCWSNTHLINSKKPVWIELDWSGIDSLKICNSGYWWVMDNFTFNESAPVPEPSTILLLGLGLVGIAGYCRKRFSKEGC